MTSLATLIAQRGGEAKSRSSPHGSTGKQSDSQKKKRLQPDEANSHPNSSHAEALAESKSSKKKPSKKKSSVTSSKKKSSKNSKKRVQPDEAKSSRAEALAESKSRPPKKQKAAVNAFELMKAALHRRLLMG